jgi:hypothetical protein
MGMKMKKKRRVAPGAAGLRRYVLLCTSRVSISQAAHVAVTPPTCFVMLMKRDMQ